MANNNGHKSQTIHFEKTPVKCQRCKKIFEHFTLEVIDDLVQLRCGEVLIFRADMACLNCGCVFYWNIREKDLEKLASSYKELLVLVKPYAPE